jgi:AbrB family looped-hinge helix DNA binding protein
MAIIKLNRRGQITIPREIRRQLGLRAGDRIILIPEGGQAMLLPMTKTLPDLRGNVKAPGGQDGDVAIPSERKAWD